MEPQEHTVPAKLVAKLAMVYHDFHTALDEHRHRDIYNFGILLAGYQQAADVEIVPTGILVAHIARCKVFVL